MPARPIDPIVVDGIRRMIADGHTYLAISQVFNVSPGTISNIRRGLTGRSPTNPVSAALPVGAPPSPGPDFVLVRSPVLSGGWTWIERVGMSKRTFAERALARLLIISRASP
jgi:AraC-like DNA-binding protein